MNAGVFVWLINAAWIILAVYLIVTARGAKRDTEGHLAQSLALMFALIAAVLLPRLEVFRFVITGAGMAFFVWARQTLGSNWSQTVSAKEGHELITSGPYRYVRHPMDTGGLIRDCRWRSLRLSSRLLDPDFSLARGHRRQARVP